MAKIQIFSGDRRYAHALMLDLSRCTSDIEVHEAMAEVGGGVAVVDIDTPCGEAMYEKCLSEGQSVVCISRFAARLNRVAKGDGVSCLHRPFRDGKLAALCLSGETDAAISQRRTGRASLTLASDCRSVLFDGETIPLTEREGALLASLLAASGDTVSKNELYRAAFGEGEDDGVVAVYIHYLRGKLEKDGRRLIYSRRGGGYCIKVREE